MHLLTNYSFQSGQKIGKMHTYEKFYPGLPDKFICVQPWSKGSKNYNWWDDVLDLIYPYLQKNNIALVQCGAKDEKPLKYCRQTQGTTSFGQLEYIVSKSCLVLSTDTVSAHIGGHYDIPIVTLVSNNYKSCVQAFFGDKSKQIILEPDRTNLKPMFTLDELEPKQINLIPPESIADAVLKLLNIDFDYKFRTISIGRFFNNKTLESCMDTVVDIKQLNAQSIVARCDINFNLVALQNQLKLCPCQIVTNQPIPYQILEGYVKNITGVVYKIDEQHDPEFVKLLIKYKIQYQLISELPVNKLNMIKLEYMDFNIIHHIKSEIPEKLKNKDLNSVWYKTSKVLLGAGKFYASEQDYINGVNFNPMENEPIKINKKNIEILWRNSDFVHFLEKA